MRYALTLRVLRLVERGSFFRFEEHLEQVRDWADALILDVGSDGTSTDPMAWPAWNSEVAGPNDTVDPITDGLSAERRKAVTLQDRRGGLLTCQVDLPPVARRLAILGEHAKFTITIRDRSAHTAT